MSENENSAPAARERPGAGHKEMPLMTAGKGSPRRPAGTGSLFIRRDAAGRESWYGKWRGGGRQIKRKLGPRRQPGTSSGLTQRQAEAELRRIMQQMATVPRLRERITVA